MGCARKETWVNKAFTQVNRVNKGEIANKPCACQQYTLGYVRKSYYMNTEKSLSNNETALPPPAPPATHVARAHSICRLTTLRRPVFLINSRQRLVLAALGNNRIQTSSLRLSVQAKPK